MTTKVQAIYAGGKLVLAEPLLLPENSQVLVTIENGAASISERNAWLSLSEQSLMKAWDNPDDDVFNELLSADKIEADLRQLSASDPELNVQAVLNDLRG